MLVGAPRVIGDERRQSRELERRGYKPGLVDLGSPVANVVQGQLQITWQALQ